MFQYVGEITEFRTYLSYGLLTTHVMGLRDYRPETLALSVTLPHIGKGQSKIEIKAQDKNNLDGFSVRRAVEFSVGSMQYKNMTNNDLLSAYSCCLMDLREGNIIEESRLIAIAINRDELEILD